MRIAAFGKTMEWARIYHAPLYGGGGMSNGNQHDRYPPAFILGGANGGLKGDRHVAVFDCGLRAAWSIIAPPIIRE